MPESTICREFPIDPVKSSVDLRFAAITAMLVASIPAISASFQAQRLSRAFTTIDSFLAGGA
jgi:hypothetical protein